MASYINISLLFALGCGVLQATCFGDQGYSKCNPWVIEQIEKLWDCNVPENRLDALKNYTGVTVATTANLFPCDAECVYSTFEDNPCYSPVTTGTSITYNNNGSYYSKEFYVAEYEGTIYNPCSKTRWYYVSTSPNEVCGIYVCSEDENAPEGYPDGLVTVPDYYCDDSKKEVELAKLDLCRMGICTVYDHSAKCNTKY